MACEAGLLPAEPAVTSVVHFDEDSQMRFAFRLA